MSSFGAGGGSASQSAGGLQGRPVLDGLGLQNIMQLLGQQMNPANAQQPAAVRPGQEAGMSPQQRLAAVMQLYGGGR